MNICEICSKACDKDIDLSDLNFMQKDSDYYKKEIEEFLGKIVKDPEKVPFVFYLINSIIARKYNNYFHYQNINECHRYCKSYEKKYKNAFLKIIYTICEDINDKEKEKDYKMFGKIFVENNKDKISLVINGVESPLVETIKINDTNKSIEVTLIYVPYDLIEDLSYMFCNCKSKSIKIIEIKNHERDERVLVNVKKISNMFNNCSYLTDIDLHFFHIFKGVKFIDSLFSGCNELNNILNLTHLNTTSVTKMDRIFNSCNKLTKIDDIYKFNTDNVESFDEMFRDCSLLEELPKDISDWKMGKAKSFKKMCKGCSSLKEIPYIKGWEGLKVQNVERMFEGCSALKKLPNIGDWDVENVTSLKGMFKDCSNLEEIPKNIADWDVKNVRSMKDMFNGCETLGIANLPNLKNWNLENLKTMKRMFFDCSKLIDENVKIENLFTFGNNETINLKNILDKKITN